MARVQRVYSGDDGNIRSALLRLPNKQDAHYSIKHLYPLEIQTTHVGTHQPHTSEGEIIDQNVENISPLCYKSSDGASPEASHWISSGRRPVRQAALTQKNLIKRKILEGAL